MLFAFSVGTLPVLLSFGVLATLISSALTHRLLRFSGMIVVILGAVMINRGLILTGSGYDLRSLITALKKAGAVQHAQLPTALPQEMPIGATTTQQLVGAARPRPALQTIEMDVIESGYKPNHFVLVGGVPVKWVINGKQITPCNHRIVVPALNLEFDVKPGLQIIEFTPNKVGTLRWSCWMGMLHGDFEVIEEAPSPAEAVVNRPIPTETEPVGRKEAAVKNETRREQYTIIKRDTLRGIAFKLYHNGKSWHEIAVANPGIAVRRLRPGQAIQLPEKALPRLMTPGK